MTPMLRTPSTDVDPEWRPVQEIVRLNFKALHDVVKAHGDAIKGLEKSVGSKVSKADHNMSLAEKANIAELSTTFDELSRVIDEKADARDHGSLLERKAGRAEVQAALSQKADVDEVQRCLDEKAGVAEMQAQIAELEARNEALESRLTQLIETKSDTTDIVAALESKVEVSEVSDLIAAAIEKLGAAFRAELVAAVEPKASKQSVTAALKAKANRTDVEELVDKHGERMHASLAAKVSGGGAPCPAGARGTPGSRARAAGLTPTLPSPPALLSHAGRRGRRLDCSRRQGVAHRGERPGRSARETWPPVADPRSPLASTDTPDLTPPHPPDPR